MATLAQIATFVGGNPELRQRFLASRVQAAWDVLAETTGTDLAARQAWAKRVFADYEYRADKEYVWTLSHALVQATGNAILDANLVTATKSFVSAWAADPAV